MSRNDHLFQFKASEISAAALRLATHHADRAAWWQAEYATAVETVKATAKLEVKEVAISGGTRADVVVDYGDISAYRRMQEAQGKIQEHKQQSGSYANDAYVYGTQGDRVYELSMADVLHYELSSNASRS